MNTILFSASGVVVLLVVSAALVMAVPPGKVMTWEPVGAEGRVAVDGAVHAGKGIKCMECHTRIFPMKKGVVRFTMNDVYAGKYCGECHNGTRSFSAKAPENCGKCHGK